VTELIPLSKVHAIEAQEEIRRKFRLIETSWVEATIMLLHFKNQEYYRPLGYDTFDAWLEDEATKSRSEVQAKLRIVRKLADTIPLAELQKIPITNCTNLCKVPEGKRLGLAEQARTMSIKDFALLVGNVPGNSLKGEEAKVYVTYCFTASGMVLVNAAIENVREEHNCSRGSALELICGKFIGEA
jgi:hypothetical protein